MSHADAIHSFLLACPSSIEQVVVLTGAGISAESGIPTFRGEEGYWTVGSTVYQPQELATFASFQKMPEEVWRWYLYRAAVCGAAAPNAAHQALVTLEEELGHSFRLVTQNVDGLHIRAGNSLERTYQVHGNIQYMRPVGGKASSLQPIPVLGLSPEQAKTADIHSIAGLHDEQGHLLRPHVLWFDEYYDEDLYRAQSAIQATARADLILVVGTSGATNLPSQMVLLAQREGIPLIDINPHENAFSGLLQHHPHALQVSAAASDAVPLVVKSILELRQ